MSSMTEVRIGNMTGRNQHDQRLLGYHNKQITRVYPKGTRLDSSNYDPVPFWNFGVQVGRVWAMYEPPLLSYGGGGIEPFENCQKGD